MSDNMVKGIGIVIDDSVNSQDDDLIIPIINNFENEGIPLVKYDRVPNNGHLDNLKYASFILLDWEFPGDTKRQEKRNLQFLEGIKDTFFAPVFVFSHLDTESIKNKLIENDLYDNERELNNFIFVKHKNDLVDDKNLFEEINEWYQEHPSAYLLKNWGHSLQEAKNETFLDLFEKSASWPEIIWQNFENESVDEKSNLSNFLFRQIKSRMPLVDFEKKIICNPVDEEASDEDIREVIAGTMFIKSENLSDEELVPGDIFEENNQYYLNIRPACDTVLGRTYESGDPVFDGYIYALKGQKIGEKDIKERYNSEYNVLIEKNNEAIIYGLKSDEFVKFSLKKLKKIDFKSYKDKRVCRLLPPHITYIQNKYSAYLSRVGLPSYPEKIYPEVDKFYQLEKSYALPSDYHLSKFLTVDK